MSWVRARLPRRKLLRDPGNLLEILHGGIEVFAHETRGLVAVARPNRLEDLPVVDLGRAEYVIVKRIGRHPYRRARLLDRLSHPKVASRLRDPQVELRVSCTEPAGLELLLDHR